MQINLSGLKAIVTGSTTGIGYAIAKGLANSGAIVVVNGRTKARVDEALKSLTTDAPGASVQGVAADLSNAEGFQQFIAQVPDADILVNNLGIFEPKDFFEIPDEDWERFFQVNVMSAVRMSRHYTPKMVSKKWGRVLFISSESGISTPAEMVHYGMTKTPMLAVSRGLAESVAGSGVTVNSILPGPTASEGVAQFVKDLATAGKKTADEVEKEFFQTMRPTSLIKRFETVDEIANLVVFAASREASAITGTSLRVDGGLVRSIL